MMTLQDAPVADTATPDSAETIVDQFDHLPLNVIVASLHNPRKSFDQGKLQELADSIKASGVHQPILVRPLPGSRIQDTFFEVGSIKPRTGAKPTHEIVAGERRYRASQLAGKATIPAMIRQLTDKQVREIQIVENLQRADLSELEEAEGYHELMTLDGINADQVAEKIGKSRSYVYGRLKLMDLSPSAREALREGKIDASKALLLARIPDVKLQAKALKEFTATDYAGENKLSYRAAKQWIEQNLMLKLGEAVFKITDAKLLPEAGSCKDCSKRTGANPDLFSDIDSPDVCTDPGCFHAKEKAHSTQVIEKAEKTGLKVISGAEAEKLCRSWNPAYVEGHQSVDDRLTDPRTGGTAPAHQLLEEFFTKEAVKDATRLVINPWTQKPIKVVTSDLLDELNQKLRAKVMADPKKGAAIRQQEAEQQAEARERDLREARKNFEKRWREKVLITLKEPLLAGAVKAFEPVLLRSLLATLLKQDSYYLNDNAVALALDLQEDQDFDEMEDEDVDAQIAKLPDDQLGARICLYLAGNDAHEVVDWVLTPDRGGRELMVIEPKALKSLAEGAGVDWKATRAEVENEMREELGLPAAIAPAAQSKDTEGHKAKSKPKSGGKKAAAAPAKLSAEDAQSGIAAAMQGVEAAASTAAGGEAAEQDPGTSLIGVDLASGESQTVITPQATWPFPKDPR